MAEENTVTMTVENIDQLFPEIVVNGESHVSDRYVAPPVEQQQSVVPSSQEEEEEHNQNTQTIQGQDVYAVELNSVLHNFSDQSLAEELQSVEEDIDDIQDLIPNQASPSNKLADKNFVNSSIATNTANFLGTYTSLADIEAIPDPTNNDYAYLDTTDSAGNTVYKRYKYNGESNEWLYEYDLNNSSFTAEQWATINSGLTQSSVEGDIASAIDELDVSVVGGEGFHIKSIKQVNGKIQAVAEEDSSGNGIMVFPTEEALDEDLPNLSDGDIVGTYGDGEPTFNDAPLGSTMSYLGNTDPSDGKWLVCDGRDTTGTAIELETHYPNLYMFLGGTNVLPEIFDHSRPSAWETITISTNSASPTTMQYDGVIYVQASRSGSQVGHYVRVFINGTEYKSSLDTSATNYWTAFMELPVKKGDSVYTTYTGTLDKMLGCFYKHHKIIKATSYVDYYHAPASEIAQIEQYVDNGVNTIKNNALSYSTEEVWTGGYWLDGKKIYRRAITVVTSSSTSSASETIINTATDYSYLETIIASKIIDHSSSFYRLTNPNMTRYSDGKLRVYAGAVGVAVGTILILEYTKTTD